MKSFHIFSGIFSNYPRPADLIQFRRYIRHCLNPQNINLKIDNTLYFSVWFRGRGCNNWIEKWCNQRCSQWCKDAHEGGKSCTNMCQVILAISATAKYAPSEPPVFLGLHPPLVLNGLTKTWTNFRDLLNKKHKNCELCRVTFITFMIWSVEIIMKYQCQCQNVSELSLSRLQHCEHSIVGTMHNVYFVQYVFLPTEQAETYLKMCVLIYHSTCICPNLFGWKENLIFKETVIFKL